LFTQEVLFVLGKVFRVIVFGYLFTWGTYGVIVKEYLVVDNASGYFWISENEYSFDLASPNGSTSGNTTNFFPNDVIG
jgi:hypothetical protein